MKRFKNILYFAHGASEVCHALERAIQLAESNQARLTVIDVIEDYPTDADLDKRLGTGVNQLLRANRLAQLEALLAPYQRSDQIIYLSVLSGIPFVEVIRSVIKNQHDLVIKASRPPEGMAERILGSTDLHLIRKCPCPVWIERPDRPHPYRHILAAVDPMRAVDQARMVLELSSSLARREQASLEILHAWRLQGESILRNGRGRIPERELDLLLARERAKHQRALDEAISRSKVMVSDEVVVNLVKGPATRSILKAAEQVDLVVMGTIGRTGMPGLLIGNTAEDVMQNTQASILAVKPDGFISPLEGV